MALTPKDIISGVVERGRKVVSEATGRFRRDHEDDAPTTEVADAPDASGRDEDRREHPGFYPDRAGEGCRDEHAQAGGEEGHAEGGREERAEVVDDEAHGRSEAEGGREAQGAVAGGEGRGRGPDQADPGREAEGREAEARRQEGGREARRGEAGRFVRLEACGGPAASVRSPRRSRPPSLWPRPSRARRRRPRAPKPAPPSPLRPRPATPRPPPPPLPRRPSRPPPPTSRPFCG